MTPSHAPIHCRGRRLTRPGTLIMGVVNVTPDSFSDGGRLTDVDAAVAHALRLVDEGADLLDVGGESTRPGAAAVSVDEEVNRVVPVIRRLVSETRVPVSVDTMKPEVAEAALDAGAHLVNDVTGFRDARMIRVTAEGGAAAVCMHMQGTPRTMQEKPTYADVVKDVAQYLRGRASALESAGLPQECIVLDPGIGFGKTLDHNLELLNRLPEICELGYPVLVGASRKSFLGTLTAFGGDSPPATDRLEGTLAAHVAAALAGARMVRVHDVAAHRRALAVADAVRAGRREVGA